LFSSGVTEISEHPPKRTTFDTEGVADAVLFLSLYFAVSTIGIRTEFQICPGN